MGGNMKRIYKSPIFWIIGIELLLSVILAILGFRVTYSPRLENSWDAVSAFAAWASVVASTAAIFVAIQIPKKIAEQQDKIALFEKRFAFYEVLCECNSFARMICNIETHYEILLFFNTSFGKKQIVDNSETSLHREGVLLKAEATNILNQGKFLFEFETKEYIDPLVSSMTALFSISENHSNFWAFYSNYQEAVKAVQDNLLPQVEMALKLSR